MDAAAPVDHAELDHLRRFRQPVRYLGARLRPAADADRDGVAKQLGRSVPKRMERELNAFQAAGRLRLSVINHDGEAAIPPIAAPRMHAIREQLLAIGDQQVAMVVPRLRIMLAHVAPVPIDGHRGHEKVRRREHLRDLAAHFPPQQIMKRQASGILLALAQQVVQPLLFLLHAFERGIQENKLVALVRIIEITAGAHGSDKLPHRPRQPCREEDGQDGPRENNHSVINRMLRCRTRVLVISSSTENVLTFHQPYDSERDHVYSRCTPSSSRNA